MSFHSWLRNLRSVLETSRIERKHRRQSSKQATVLRPRLEPLEDRSVPAFLAPVEYDTSPGPSSVASGDFNNDGHLDLVTAGVGSVSFRPGNGSGGFGEAITSAAASAAYTTQDRSLAVGDFNADGNLDLAMVNDYALSYYGNYDPDPSNGLSVMFGNGDGRFQAPSNVPLYDGATATERAMAPS